MKKIIYEVNLAHLGDFSSQIVFFNLILAIFDKIVFFSSKNKIGSIWPFQGYFGQNNGLKFYIIGINEYTQNQCCTDTERPHEIT